MCQYQLITSGVWYWCDGKMVTSFTSFHLHIWNCCLSQFCNWWKLFLCSLRCTDSVLTDAPISVAYICVSVWEYSKVQGSSSQGDISGYREYYTVFMCFYSIIIFLIDILVVLYAKFVLQDLPEFFEDNMATWMTHFQTLLTTNNPLLVTEVTVLCLLFSLLLSCVHFMDF